MHDSDGPLDEEVHVFLFAFSTGTAGGYSRCHFEAKGWSVYQIRTTQVIWKCEV